MSGIEKAITDANRSREKRKKNEKLALEFSDFIVLLFRELKVKSNCLVSKRFQIP